MSGLPSGTTPAERGANAETAATRYLIARGLTLIERNYRCRLGELDIIMRDAQHLVFVEVRYRHPSRFGSALESLSASKRQRLILAAQHYLMTRMEHFPVCRFDLIALADQSAPIEWHKNIIDVPR